MIWELSDDELTLHLIATGLVAVRRLAESGATLSYPYPAPLQQGWNRLVATCLMKGVESPIGLDNLFAWCRAWPLAQWPLTLPLDEMGPSDTLIDGPFLTETCEEWASASSDVEAELTENQIMERAIGICRIKNAQATYAAFRRLLIEYPVLTRDEHDKHRLARVLEPLEQQFIDAFIEAPESYVVDDSFHCCPYCGGLLQSVKGQFVCEEKRCRARGRITPSRSIPAASRVLHLRRGLHRYVTIPGLTEIRLAERLENLGLTVEMWPGIEAYDLRVSFPTGAIWALEVKDRKDPCRLAKATKPIPDNPSWTQAFFVFPDERKEERADYKRAFENSRPPSFRQAHTKAVFFKELIRAAKQELGKV